MMNRLSFEVMVIPPAKKVTLKVGEQTEENLAPLSISKDRVALWFKDSKIQKIKNRPAQTVFYPINELKNIEFKLKWTSFKSKEHDIAYIFEFSSQTDVHWKNMSTYDTFIDEFERTVRKNKGKCIFLDRKLSKYYSEKMYPIFNDFENELRRLIQVILFKEFGREWEKEFFSQKQLKQMNGKSILEELDLTGLEALLFEKIFIQKSDGFIFETKLIREFDVPDDLLNFFINSEGNFRRFSAWDEYFSDYVKPEFQGEAFIENYKRVKKVRNKVAHHKKVRNTDFQFIKTFLGRFTKEIKSLSTSIIYNEELVSFANLFTSMQTFGETLQKTMTPVFENIGNMMKGLTDSLTNLYTPTFLESLNKIPKIGMNNFDYSNDEDIDDDLENDIEENE